MTPGEADDGQLHQAAGLLSVNKVDSEAARLDTFGPKWPHQDEGQCSKHIMARAGYFYLGRADKVECFCCGIRLQGWEPDEDRPWDKHKQYCVFGSLRKPEGQLKLGELFYVLANQKEHMLDKILSITESKFA